MGWSNTEISGKLQEAVNFCREPVSSGMSKEPGDRWIKKWEREWRL